MDPKVQALVDECERQQESCQWTSTGLFEWMKELRFIRGIFVVAPILFGAAAGFRLFIKEPGYEGLVAVFSLLAGLFPAVYKALDLDVSLKTLTTSANTFKNLHDRFRIAAQVTSYGAYEEFKAEVAELMGRMDAARLANPPVPERYFKRAKKKIEGGHYGFAVDLAEKAP